MNVTPISMHRTENRISRNNSQPNFGLLRKSHRPEMKTAQKILEKNCPDFYNNLVSSLQEILGNTAFFDGLLDIKDGQLVLKMIHKKNFVWPGKETGLIWDTEKEHCYISRGTKETEFHPDFDRILRIIKINEDKHKVTYSVKDWHKNRPYNEEWSLKASPEQAQLIKEFDDTIGNMASKGSVYLGYGEGDMEYFPLRNS